MISLIHRAAAVMALLLVAGTSAAQSTGGDLTIELPLNLTQVSPDITKVGMSCILGNSPQSSDAFPVLNGALAGQGFGGRIELPVMGGQLTMTARFVVPLGTLLGNPIGATVLYQCRIDGYSASLQEWRAFDEAHTNPAFRLTPTPQIFMGSFVW